MVKKIFVFIAALMIFLCAEAGAAYDDLHIARVGAVSVGGTVLTALLDDNMVFIAYSDSIKCYDLSNDGKQSLKCTISVLSPPEALKRRGNNLFVLQEKMISVYRLDEENIPMSAKYTFGSGYSGKAWDVTDDRIYISANTDYGGAGSLGLVIIDAREENLRYTGATRNLRTLYYGGNKQTMGAFRVLKADGDMLYGLTECLASGQNPKPGAIMEIDISNPSAPHVISAKQIQYNAVDGTRYAMFSGMEIYGKSIYISVADGQKIQGGSEKVNGLWHYDMQTKDCTYLDLSGAYEGKRVNRIFINGDILYMPSQDAKSIRIFDLSGGAPVFIRKETIPEIYVGMSFCGFSDNMFLIRINDASGTLLLYRVSESANDDIFLSDENGKKLDMLSGGEKVCAAVKLSNYSASGATAPYTALMAVYSGNRLISAKAVKNPFADAGGLSKTVLSDGFKLPDNPIGFSARIFKIDSMSGITPLDEVKSYGYAARDRSGLNSIFVDPVNGSDSNSGSFANPLRTIEEARNTVRNIKDTVNENIYIHLAEGKYFLDKTLTFDERDSGINGNSVIYSGNNAVISGGRRIDGWTLFDSEKNIYCADTNGKYSRQLYVNGKRAVRARSKGGIKAESTDKNVGIYTKQMDLLSFKKPGDVECVFKCVWSSPRVSVEAVESTGEGSLIKMKQPFWNIAADRGQIIAKDVWYYENAYELLDEAGEFYIDKENEKIYYIPECNVDMNSAEIYMPVIETLVNINGSENITFRGISFEHSSWNIPSVNGAFVDNQNNQCSEGVDMPSAINVSFSKNISFKKCIFKHLGAEGLSFFEGSVNCSVTGNVFYDISGGALWAGSISSPVSTQSSAQYGFSVKNNYIHDTSVEYYGGAALTIGHISDSEFMHNEIANVPYSGFHVGWGWAALEKSDINNLIISKNYIHDVMQSLDDGGAVYLLGGTGGDEERRNIVSENYIKNVMCGTSPLYCDNGSSWYELKKNVLDLRVGYKSIYAFIGKGAHDNVFYENYTTSSKYIDRGENDVVQNTLHYPNADFPAEAQEIIDNAGLESEYLYLKQVN